MRVTLFILKFQNILNLYPFCLLDVKELSVFVKYVTIEFYFFWKVNLGFLDV